MAKAYRAFASVILAFFFVHSSLGSHARAADRETRVDSIEELVVTGRKREEPIQQTPLSMVALTPADLDVRAIRQVDEIGQAVAGLKFDTTVGTDDSARIFIRGVGQASDSDEVDPGVGLYVDGVYYPRVTGSVLRLFDLERVEVLRGPEGTLFGKNTVGGVVHLITRKPGEEFAGRAEVRHGNLGLLETQLSVNVPIALGSLERRAFSRFSFATATDEGFIRNVLDGENGGDNKLLAGRWALRLLPSDDMEANLKLERSRENQKAPLGECRRVVDIALSTIIVDNTSFFREACDESSIGTPEFEAFSSDPIKNKLDIVGTTGSLSWNLGSLTLRSTSSWRQLANRNRGGDTDGTRAEFTEQGPGKSKDDAVSHELLLQGRAMDQRMFFTTGAYWLREEGRSQGETRIQRNVIANPDIPLVGFAEAPPTFQEFNDATSGPGQTSLTLLELLRSSNRRTIEKFTTYSYAAFGEVSYQLNPRLNLTGGLRYTEERKSRRRKSLAVFGPAFIDGSPSGEIKPASADSFGEADARFDEWTGRILFAFRVTDDSLLFGGLSRGFRSGGFDDGQVTDESSGGVRPFDTEKLDSFELGLKTSWLGQRLVLNLSGFYNKYEDIQLSILSTGADGLPTVNIQNAGRAIVQGLELEFQARPAWIEGLRLSGGVSLIHAEYKEFREDVVRPFMTDQCSSLRLSECPPSRLVQIATQLSDPRSRTEINADVSDRDFSQTPAFSFNAQAAYRFDLGSWGTLAPAIQWYHQGKTFQDVRNSKRAQQPKFGLLNGRIAWLSMDGATTISLFARNILDRRYIAGAEDLSDQTGTNQVFYARPRTWGVEVTREF